jgi:hypothetical protein
VREGFVGLGHAMDVVFLFDCAAAGVGSVV